MEIHFGGPSGLQKTSSTSKKKSKNAAAFKDTLSSGKAASESAPLSDSAPVLEPSMFVETQETSDALKEKKRAAQKGGELLNHLKTWQKNLLLGTLSKDDFQKLEALLLSLEKSESFQNPQLNALMEDIKLRTAVELAKFERG